MKTVLITGASSGIGLELANVYAENGYNLFITARRENNLKELKNSIENKHKVKVDYFPLDLSKPDSADILHSKTKELGINTDVLINNAGFGIFDDFLDSEINKTEMMLNLNILSLTKLTHLYASDMVKQGSGNIINIASMAAFQPVPHLAAYSASKTYVLNFSEAIAFELKPKNVFVTVINPGATESEFADTAGFKKGEFESKIPTSRTLAEFTFKEMNNKKVLSIHGTKNAFLAFSQRFVPRSVVTKMAASMMKKN